ncbi:hypothetical protein K4K59_001352 [Colletotrichum sp. SAR11_240]|nr:hypothetical protein K4K59_001352 [Colletotrichum sp. SAR11_240]
MKRKIALSCALGVGAIGGAVAIVKSIRLPQLREDDFTCMTPPSLKCHERVEGSTITIASTIPVLQPLLELILRRNPFSTAKNTTEETPKFYEDYASQRESRGGSKIELGQRKPRPKPRDDLGFTIMEDDSQENILPECKRPAPAFMSDRHETTPPQSADGGIVRTDVVCVSFEDRGPLGEKLASSKWDIV